MTDDALERFRRLQADEAGRIIRDLNREHRLVLAELEQTIAECEALRAELRRMRERERDDVPWEEWVPTGKVLGGP